MANIVLLFGISSLFGEPHGEKATTIHESGHTLATILYLKRIPESVYLLSEDTDNVGMTDQVWFPNKNHIPGFFNHISLAWKYPFWKFISLWRNSEVLGMLKVCLAGAASEYVVGGHAEYATWKVAQNDEPIRGDAGSMRYFAEIYFPMYQKINKSKHPALEAEITIDDFVETLYQDIIKDFKETKNQALIWALADALQEKGILYKNDIEKLLADQVIITKQFMHKLREEGRIPKCDTSKNKYFKLPFGTPKYSGSIATAFFVSVIINASIGVLLEGVLGLINPKQRYQMYTVRALQLGVPLALSAVVGSAVYEHI